MEDLARLDDLGRQFGFDPEWLRALVTPAVRLRPTEADCFSQLGGHPTLPESTEWPYWDPRDNDRRALAFAEAQSSKMTTDFWRGKVEKCRAKQGRAPVPLSFIAQLGLHELPRDIPGLPLPGSGYLWFFYELEEMPWGFCPSHRGSFRVIGASASEPLAEREAPSGAFVSESCTKVSLHPVATLPEWPEVDENRWDAYSELKASLGEDEPWHQVGGHPETIQGDMTTACAMVTRGVYLGRPPDLSPDQRVQFEAEAKNWRLLLQIASDESLDWMWGDLGNLYWWMREDDIGAQRWDQAWFKLQCS